MKDPQIEQLLSKVGDRLKALRKAKGYSDYELFAYENNIGRAQYGRYEKGSDLRLSSLFKVLEAMEDFDRIVIGESVKSRTGSPTPIVLMGRTNKIPMNIFMNIAQQTIGQKIDLFWVDGGVPGHFALRGEQSLSVIFHSRQVELCAHLRSITFNEA